MKTDCAISSANAATDDDVLVSPSWSVSCGVYRLISTHVDVPENATHHLMNCATTASASESASVCDASDDETTSGHYVRDWNCYCDCVVAGDD